MRLPSLRDLLAHPAPDQASAATPVSTLPRAARAALAVGFGVLWLLDLAMSLDTAGPLLPLAGLVPAALVLFGPRGRPGLRAGAAALWSLLWSAVGFVRGAGQDSPGLMELLALSLLLVTTARNVRDRAAALGTCAALVAALLGLAARVSRSTSGAVLTVVLLAVVAGVAIALGSYLRSADTRRLRAVERVRRDELIDLANDLNDFVAHHVTGIIVLAQAGRAVWQTAPQEVVPIFDDIEQAGSESLESMRQLVAMLREGTDLAAASPLSGQGIAHIPVLVDSFRRGGASVDLQLDEAALSARLAPEIVTTAHRVITEGLSNVRRHAPDAAGITVRIALGPTVLEAAVLNGPPSGGTVRKALRVPHLGQQGLGLLGLRERVRAVGGTLTGRPDDTGGWELTALLPVRDTDPSARRMPA
ncbi:sensor histidine kinase [Kitasatospora sp. NPDC018619]|uniref:sensor histidine kinase n=1 Tax=unclassified Kitasatospora TaxID=2633591 RepID=UPI0037B3B287